MTPKDSMRQRALELLRAGMITHAEAAEYLKLSRQGVRYICLQAGIDAATARRLYLRRLFAPKIMG